DRARKPKRDAHAAALDAAFDGRVELARGEDLDSRPRREPAPFQLAQAGRIVVGHTLHHHPLALAAVTEHPLTQRAHLPSEARDGMPVRVELRPAEELEDASLHGLGADVLQPLRLL